VALTTKRYGKVAAAAHLEIVRAGSLGVRLGRDVAHLEAVLRISRLRDLQHAPVFRPVGLGELSLAIPDLQRSELLVALIEKFQTKPSVLVTLNGTPPGLLVMNSTSSAAFTGQPVAESFWNVVTVNFDFSTLRSGWSEGGCDVGSARLLPQVMSMSFHPALTPRPSVS
jgi:hypothetical protein